MVANDFYPHQPVLHSEFQNGQDCTEDPISKPIKYTSKRARRKKKKKGRKKEGRKRKKNKSFKKAV